MEKKETLIKLALTGFIGVSSAAGAAETDLPAPWTIEEVCKATEEAVDGQGLSPEILNFLQELDRQGKFLECDTAYEGGIGGGLSLASKRSCRTSRWCWLIPKARGSIPI